jgi:hypothetical protein
VRECKCDTGFWIENLTDMFITLAFPAAERFGVSFAIIFLARIVENLAYLWFQMDAWFKFRIWIKGKFKKDQVRATHTMQTRANRRPSLKIGLC